jgi:methyl coenzyme M reductase subunit C-like uncharacterized protein (methanogenesis marker protein 7)
MLTDHFKTGDWDCVGRRDADLLQNLDLPETFIALVLPHLNRDRLGHPALAVLELLAVSQTLHAVIILALCFGRHNIFNV